MPIDDFPLSIFVAELDGKLVATSSVERSASHCCPFSSSNFQQIPTNIPHSANGTHFRTAVFVYLST